MSKKIINFSLLLVFSLVLWAFSESKLYAASCTYGGGSCVGWDADYTSCESGGGSYSSQDCAPASGTGTPATTTTTFVNPIKFTTVSELLNSILNNLMGIIAIVAVIFIVIGGVMYMTSGGNETMVTRAKKTWTYAVIGLAIALAAPTFLKEIQNILGGGGTGGNAQNWVANALTIEAIATKVLNLLLSIIGIIAIIALVVGGGMYLTSYGDEKKIETAKRILTFAIIGIVVALASLVIVRQVSSLLGAS